MTSHQLFVFMLLVFFVALFGTVMIADSDNSKARSVLAAQGYTNVHFTGIPWFECSDTDSNFTSKSFSAELNGTRIEGVVCCGLILKSCTLRF